MQQIRQQQGPTASRIFNIKEVQDDIEASLRDQHGLQPRQLAPPMTAKDVGRLTAEAITGQYELAAKEVEAMGHELKARLVTLETTKTETLEAIDEITETAARFRDEGKRISLQIEDCAAMTAEVRQTCGVLKQKIAAPSS